MGGGSSALPKYGSLLPPPSPRPGRRLPVSLSSPLSEPLLEPPLLEPPLLEPPELVSLLSALPTPPPPSPDKMLEGTVIEGLKKKGIDGVTVTVANGEVTLTGKVDKAKVPEVMMVANEAKPSKVINNLNK